MSHPAPHEVVRDLPAGLVARAVTVDDVEALTALERAVDLACTGTSASNPEEMADWLGEPSVQWGAGAAVVERASDVVASLVTVDEVASGRGWSFDTYTRPGDPDGRAIVFALTRAGLELGQRRWAGPAQAGEVDPAGLEATAACYEQETDLRAAFAALGFAEARRFWWMSIRHDRPAPPLDLPAGYSLRPVDVTDPAELHRMHDVGNTCFLDHYGFSPQPFEEWWEVRSSETEDPTQWKFVERDGQVAAYVRGSNRFASEGLGHVDSLGVLREHRGRGIAGALLRAHFADDIERGRSGTRLHVDSTSPTGATHVYERAGMRVEQEYISHTRPLLDT